MLEADETGAAMGPADFVGGASVTGDLDHLGVKARGPGELKKALGDGVTIPAQFRRRRRHEELKIAMRCAHPCQDPGKFLIEAIFGVR